MDDLQYGTRNKRGDWAPTEPLDIAPLFSLPRSLWRSLKWLPHYFLPWNVVFFAFGRRLVGLGAARRRGDEDAGLGLARSGSSRSTPSRSSLFFGAFELQLYVLQRAGNALQIQRQVSVRAGRARRSGSRARTSTICCAPSYRGVPIWTAIEVAML